MSHDRDVIATMRGLMMLFLSALCKPLSARLSGERPRSLMKTLRSTSLVISLTLSLMVGLTACLELTSSPPEPCGGQTSCSAPRTCVEGVCVASCYTDEECGEGERCERSLCVPTAVLEEMSGGEMSGGEMSGEEMSGGEMSGGAEP
jgi:hypothetical protein